MASKKYHGQIECYLISSVLGKKKHFEMLISQSQRLKKYLQYQQLLSNRHKYHANAHVLCYNLTLLFHLRGKSLITQSFFLKKIYTKRVLLVLNAHVYEYRSNHYVTMLDIMTESQTKCMYEWDKKQFAENACSVYLYMLIQ